MQPADSPAHQGASAGLPAASGHRHVQPAWQVLLPAHPEHVPFPPVPVHPYQGITALQQGVLLPYPGAHPQYQGVHPPSQGAAAPHHAAVRLPSEAEVQLHAAAAPFPGAVLLPIGAVLLPTGAALPPPEVLLHQEAIPADTVHRPLPAAAVLPAAIPVAGHPEDTPVEAVPHPVAIPAAAVLPAAVDPVHLHTGSL